MRLPAPLLSLLVALLAARAGAETIASVDATATVESPGLPAPKAGGRDLSHAFGPDAGAVLQAEMQAELLDLQAFREFLPAGGEYRLQVTVTSLRRELRELGGRKGETADQMEISAEAVGSWFRGEEPLLTSPVTPSRRISLDGPPTKGELQVAFRSIFREIAQRSFSDLYEKRFFHSIQGSVSGR